MTTPITAMAKEHAVLSAGGGGITVVGADMTAGSFMGVAWTGVRFVDCVFGGRGNVALAAMSDCSFLTCRFLSADHDFGVMQGVRFRQCASQGRTIVCGRDGSTAVVFEQCSFAGGGSAPQDFRGIGCTGEVTFRNCIGSGEVLVAGTALTMEGCRFSDMSFAIGRRADRGTPLAARVLIDGCLGTGLWRMVDCRMQTSHIQNSRFDRIVNDGSECES